MSDIPLFWNTSFKPLIWGFVLSFALTLAAYFLVVQASFGQDVLMFWVVGLGTVQALIQFIFFLHLGAESKPHWYLITFLFMVLVVVVVIGGSLWIMHNLDYNVMPMKEQGTF